MTATQPGSVQARSVAAGNARFMRRAVAVGAALMVVPVLRATLIDETTRSMAGQPAVDDDPSRRIRRRWLRGF